MALLDPYATFAQYKDRFNLSSDTRKLEIEELLIDASRRLEQHLQVAPGYFNTHAATYVFSGHGGKVLRLRDARGLGYCLTAITADSCKIDDDLDGTYEYTLDLSDNWLNGIPENAAQQGEPFTALELTPTTSATITLWPNLPRSIAITGTWGWAQVPRAITELCLFMTREMVDLESGGVTQQLFDIAGNPAQINNSGFGLAVARAKRYGRMLPGHVAV